MVFCPFCGRTLQQKLIDGISSCSNCYRVFDSSQKNRLLSAAWYIRHLCLMDTNNLRSDNELTDVELDFLIKYVYEKGYNHDELLKLFKTVII